MGYYVGGICVGKKMLLILAGGIVIVNDSIRVRAPGKETILEAAFLVYHLLDRKGTGWLACRNRTNRTFPKSILQ